MTFPKRKYRVWALDKNSGKPNRMFAEFSTQEEALNYLRGLTIDLNNPPVIETPEATWLNSQGGRINRPGSRR